MQSEKKKNIFLESFWNSLRVAVMNIFTLGVYPSKLYKHTDQLVKFQNNLMFPSESWQSWKSK